MSITYLSFLHIICCEPKLPSCVLGPYRFLWGYLPWISNFRCKPHTGLRGPSTQAQVERRINRPRLQDWGKYAPEFVYQNPYISLLKCKASSSKFKRTILHAKQQDLVPLSRLPQAWSTLLCSIMHLNLLLPCTLMTSYMNILMSCKQKIGVPNVLIPSQLA